MSKKKSDAALSGGPEGYKRIKQLGQGSFGIVYLVERRTDKATVVEKVIQVAGLTSEDFKVIRNEIALLKKLKHPLIVRFLEAVQTPEGVSILMEYADGGTLEDILNDAKTRKVSVSEDEILDYFVQACLAIQFCHEQRVLHRDLKLANLFLTHDGILKMGDFGLSKALGSQKSMASTTTGTPYYMSPEVLSSNKYGRKNDVWALGVMLYELLTLRKPFEAQSMGQLVTVVLKGEYRPIPSTRSRAVRGLVDRLLQSDPNHRISLEGALQLPFLREKVAKWIRHVQQLSEESVSRNLSGILEKIESSNQRDPSPIERRPKSPLPRSSQGNESLDNLIYVDEMIMQHKAPELLPAYAEMADPSSNAGYVGRFIKSNLFRLENDTNALWTLAINTKDMSVVETAAREILEKQTADSPYRPFVLWRNKPNRANSAALTLPASDKKVVTAVSWHVTSIATSASMLKAFITVASESGRVSTWDTFAGVEKWSFVGPAWVTSCVISPDGRTGAASFMGVSEIKVFEAQTGREMLTLPGHKSGTACVIFKNDREILTGGGDKSIQAWDLKSKKSLWAIAAHGASVNTLALSPRKDFLVSGSLDKTAKVWDLKSRKEVFTLSKHSGWLLKVAYSLDGTMIATSSKDRTVAVWDASSGALLKTLPEHDGWVHAIAFTKGHMLLTAAHGRNATLKVWNPRQGSRIATIPLPSAVMSIGISNGGNIACGRHDGGVTIFEKSEHGLVSEYQDQRRGLTTKSAITCAAFSKGSLAVVGTIHKEIQIWNGHGELEGCERDSLDSALLAVGFDSEDKFLSLSNKHEPKRADPRKPSSLLKLYSKAGKDGITMAISQQDVMAIGTRSGETRLVKTDGSLVGTIPPVSKGEVSAVAFAWTGSRLAVAQGDSPVIRLCDGPNKLMDLEGHTGRVCALAFSPQLNTLASGGSDMLIKIWNNAGRLLQTLSSHSANISSLGFSVNGLLLSGSADKTVKWWDIESTDNPELYTYYCEAAVTALAVSPTRHDMTSIVGDERGQVYILTPCL